jgi:DUF971 family protein
LRIAARGSAFVVAWADGTPLSLAAAVLREGCRCARCIASRAAGKPPPVDPDAAITAVEPIGRYAVNRQG